MSLCFALRPSATICCCHAHARSSVCASSALMSWAFLSPVIQFSTSRADVCNQLVAGVFPLQALPIGIETKTCVLLGVAQFDKLSLVLLQEAGFSGVHGLLAAVGHLSLVIVHEFKADERRCNLILPCLSCHPKKTCCTAWLLICSWMSNLLPSQLHSLISGCSGLPGMYGLPKQCQVGTACQQQWQLQNSTYWVASSCICWTRWVIASISLHTTK
jgi:hypothetical protein